jgi:hypothetical protein
MFKAASASLSRTWLQTQVYVRFNKAGPLFFAPQAGHILLDGNYPSIFIKRFTCPSSLHSKNWADIPHPMPLTDLSKFGISTRDIKSWKTFIQSAQYPTKFPVYISDEGNMQLVEVYYGR